MAEKVVENQDIIEIGNNIQKIRKKNGISQSVLAEKIDVAGNSIYRMCLLILPAFVFAMYEKDGLPLEKVLKNIIVVRFIRPSVRKYQVENMYEKKQRIVRKKGGRERVKKKK